MPRTRVFRHLVLSGALALLSLPGPAAAAPASSTLLRLDGGGSRWFTMQLATDGGRIQVELRLRGAQFPVALAASLYDDERHLATGDFFVDSAGGHRAQVDLPLVGDPGLEQTAQNDEYGATSTFVLNPDGPVLKGVFTLAVWGASDRVEAHRLQVDGAPGTRVLSHRSGSEAVAFDEQDFRDGSSVVVRQHVGGVGTADVVQQVGGRYEFRVRNTLLGHVRRSDLTTTYSSGQLEVDTPYRGRQCPCSWITGFDQDGTGTYVATSTGTSVGVDDDNEVVDLLDDRPVGVTGSLADVRFPAGFVLPQR